jgi:hypothetical protein
MVEEASSERRRLPQAAVTARAQQRCQSKRSHYLARSRKADPPTPGEVGERDRLPDVKEVHFVQSIPITRFTWCSWICLTGACLGTLCAFIAQYARDSPHDPIECTQIQR